MRAMPEVNAGDLRLRVTHLRQQLTETTDAYHKAVSQHDSERAIPLLRARSQLMRQLLDAQCELLLSLRADPAPAALSPSPVAVG